MATLTSIYPFISLFLPVGCKKENIIPSFNLEKLKKFLKPLVMRILTVKYTFLKCQQEDKVVQQFLAWAIGKKPLKLEKCIYMCVCVCVCVCMEIPLVRIYTKVSVI